MANKIKPKRWRRRHVTGKRDGDGEEVGNGHLRQRSVMETYDKILCDGEEDDELGGVYNGGWAEAGHKRPKSKFRNGSGF